MPERTSQFMSVEGFETVLTVRDCGCFHESAYTSDGELVMIRLQICGACFDAAGQFLEALDNKPQLTLPLPLAEGDRGRDEQRSPYSRNRDF